MIKSYHDLNVWQYGRRLVVETYRMTASFPKHELYGLASQMQRASVSIPSNIAEGFSRRGTKDYMQFISIAIGSLNELDTQSYVAQDLGYISENQIQPYRNTIISLQKMLHSMRGKLKDATVKPMPNAQPPMPPL
jgi:four helix bundle protein